MSCGVGASENYGSCTRDKCLVAALRETSVLFAVLMGAWFLKERFNRRRLMGTLTILGGVMALRLG